MDREKYIADAAERFTRTHPVGTPVRYWPVLGRPDFEDTKIRSEAWALWRGTIVVKIEGRTAGVPIGHLQKI